METLNEFIEAVESANNVSFVIYNSETKKWLVNYKNGLPPDILETQDLIEFLQNG